MVAGEPHDLDRSSHELLRCLLQEAGTVVPKERLLQAGWQGRVVSENSLTKAIGRLRVALNDHDGKLLCTAHGYGYRLAGRVEFIPFTMAAVPAVPAQAAPEPESGALPLAAAARRVERRRSWAWTRLPWLAALALLCVFVWLQWGPAAPSDAAPAGTATTTPRPWPR